MSTSCRPLAGHSAKRLFILFSLCLFLLSLGACVKGGSKGGEQPSPNEKKLAYDLAMNVPDGWAVNNATPPEATKDSLDARRKNGDAIPLFEVTGGASARGIPSSINVTLVNEEGAFIPRQYAEKLTPEEFDVMARDMMDREKALAKKNKTKNSLLDMRFSRDSIGGNLALMQRLTVVGPEGKPVRLMGWDVYLPNGAGLMIRVVCDQEVPNAESEVINLVKTLRTK